MLIDLKLLYVEEEEGKEVEKRASIQGLGKSGGGALSLGGQLGWIQSDTVGKWRHVEVKGFGTEYSGISGRMMTQIRRPSPTQGMRFDNATSGS